VFVLRTGAPTSTEVAHGVTSFSSSGYPETGG
jgi:hypothetical protein